MHTEGVNELRFTGKPDEAVAKLASGVDHWTLVGGTQVID